MFCKQEVCMSAFILVQKYLLTGRGGYGLWKMCRDIPLSMGLYRNRHHK